MKTRTGMRSVVFLFLISQLAAAENPAPAGMEPSAKILHPGEIFQSTLGIRGVPVAMVLKAQPGSVAEQIGLKTADLVTGFNEKMVGDYRDFNRFLSEMRIEALLERADLRILKFDPIHSTYSAHRAIAVVHPSDGSRYIGFATGFRYFVQEVLPGGVAEGMGVRRGELIHSINGQRLGNLRGPSDLDRIIRETMSTADRQLTLSLGLCHPIENGSYSMNAREAHGVLPSDDPS